MGVSSSVFSSSTHAAVLVVDGGILTGAKGVDVGGILYNVEFVDGTCPSLFNGCDESTDFVFTDIDSALLATAALLDQVFIDGPDGPFDTDPSLTAGCPPVLGSCGVLNPFGIGDVPFPSQNSLLTIVTFNNSTLDDSATFFEQWRIDSTDTSLVGGAVFADWQVSPIPIPAAVWLFGSALIGLIGFSKRKKAA